MILANPKIVFKKVKGFCPDVSTRYLNKLFMLSSQDAK